MHARGRARACRGVSYGRSCDLIDDYFAARLAEHRSRMVFCQRSQQKSEERARCRELRKEPWAREPEQGTLAGPSRVAVAETTAAPQQAGRRRVAASGWSRRAHSEGGEGEAIDGRQGML